MKYLIIAVFCLGGSALLAGTVERNRFGLQPLDIPGDNRALCTINNLADSTATIEFPSLKQCLAGCPRGTGVCEETGPHPDIDETDVD